MFVKAHNNLFCIRDNRMDLHIWLNDTKGKSCGLPDEFLSWAKQDIVGGERRSIANALTNAKRAIHARIDEIIIALRVPHAADWPKTATTDDILKVLKQIKVPVTSIAKVLTARRNNLEHNYLLPSLDQARADVETAELWLDKSKEYLNPSVSFMGLLVNGLGFFTNADAQKGTVFVTFSERSKVTYFSEAKKSIMTVNKSGFSTQKKYADLKWKELVEIQKDSYLFSQNKFTIPSSQIATKLFTAYKNWLLGKRGNKFSASHSFE